ncbi:hypothetical protein JXQ70_00255 [bacterium]|nr:hypothetical protein [bacterium]
MNARTKYYGLLLAVILTVFLVLPMFSEAAVLFSDDFESYPTGNFNGGGGWSITQNPRIVQSFNGNDTKVIELFRANRSEGIYRNLSTTSHENIALQFEASGQNREYSDYIQVAWRQYSWQSFSEIWISYDPCSSWTIMTVPLPTNCWNNNDFQIQIVCRANNNNEQIYIDNVLITGDYVEPTPTPTPTATPTPTPTPTPLECGDWSAITELTSNVEIACMAEGEEYHPFIDNSTYCVVWMPDHLKNLPWLRTYYAHKDATDAEFITFKVTKDATVYVAYHHDASYRDLDNTTRYPNKGPEWLRLPSYGWTYSYDRISIGKYESYGYNKIPSYWDVWEKEYTAGQSVILGGNKATGVDTGSSYHDPGMYLIIVDIHDETTIGTTIEYPTTISNIPPFFLSPPEPKIMFLYDNSGSMVTDSCVDTFGRRRVQLGRDVLVSLIDSITNVEVGMATYVGINGSHPYPWLYDGCEDDFTRPSGKSLPFWPASENHAAQDLLTCLSYPCGSNSPSTAQILTHPKHLTDQVRNEIKYGTHSGSWAGRNDWDPLPPFANSHLKRSEFFGSVYSTSSCNYHKPQGIEGICRTSLSGSNGWTPIAGSLWGIRDYLEQFLIPMEIDETSDFYNPAYKCTRRYVILVTDGLETVDSTSNPPVAAADLRYVLRTNPVLSPYFTDDMFNEVRTYVVGLGFAAGSSGMNALNAIAEAGGTDANLDGDTTTHDEAFPAEDADSLEASLLKAIQDVIEGTFQGSAVAVEMDIVAGYDKIYAATFVPRDWSGNLIAYQLNPDGSLPTDYMDHPLWNVADWLYDNWESRPVYTSLPPSPYMLNFSEVLHIDNGGLYTTNELAYFIGDPSNEQRESGNWRSRVAGPLGDIIQSSPNLVVPPRRSYKFNDYPDYRSDMQNRQKMLYFGANDGFLHAVNADDGSELWAYHPIDTAPKLKHLLDPLYVHEYFVDGEVVSADVYTQNAWRTLLAFPLRAGGRSVHVLDVTDPDPATNAGELERGGPKFFHRVMDDSKLGYIIDRISILRAGTPADPIWTLVISSGLENDDQKGHVLFLNLETRELHDVVLDRGSDELGHYVTRTVAIDSDFDDFADTIYVADVRGCIWKIDISSTNMSQWDVFHKSGSTTYPMFRSTDASGNEQPITTDIGVTLSCHDICLLFGTGQMLNENDKIIERQNTFYAIVDSQLNDSDNRDFDRTILDEIVMTDNGDGTRGLSNCLTFNNKGEYIDFLTLGERVIVDPIVFNGLVFLTTAVLDSDRCGSGGTSWVYYIPFYATCQQRDEEPELDVENMGSFYGTSMIIGAEFSPPIYDPNNPESGGGVYISGTDGNISPPPPSDNPNQRTFNIMTWKETLE